MDKEPLARRKPPRWNTFDQTVKNVSGRQAASRSPCHAEWAGNAPPPSPHIRHRNRPETAPSLHPLRPARSRRARRRPPSPPLRAPARSDAPLGGAYIPARCSASGRFTRHRPASPEPAHTPARAHPARPAPEPRGPPRADLDHTHPGLLCVLRSNSRQVHRRHPAPAPAHATKTVSAAPSRTQERVAVDLRLELLERITSAIRRAMKSSVACAFRLSSPSQ